MHTFTSLAQDYSKLIESGGPVLVAFVVLFVAAYILGAKIMLPALTLYRAITLDVVHITDTLKDTRKRLEHVADQLDTHLPPEKKYKPSTKSVYES